VTKTFTKPQALYETFERKGGPNPSDTHYCPGCGHGTIHKLMAEAIDDLGIGDRTVLISPVGCSVFAYYYFDCGNIQAAHGRAPAVGTGVKRARPQSIVISYQGDGDLGAIGFNNIMQAANRGERMTVIFVNNAIYGMTGGQMAPTTLIGQRTTTTPRGRTQQNEGYPIHMCELVSQLEAPIYVERCSLATPKLTMKARKAIRRALQSQAEGKGFSFVEILSQCPTGWKLSAADSLKWIEEHLMPVFPVKVFKDRIEEIDGQEPDMSIPTPERVIEMVAPPAQDGGHGHGDGDVTLPDGIGEPRTLGTDETLSVKIAGFGGQGILYLGEVLASAAMGQGHHVSWLPSYGPEMRGGTAHCHVKVSGGAIGSPLVEGSTHLIAMNGPSLGKFGPDVVPGGMIFYNSSMIETPPERTDVVAVPVPATEAASELGSIRVANMVMLGAMMARTGVIDLDHVVGAFAAGKGKAHLIDINRRAIVEGMKLAMAASA
jgi:2-oxoisovalerate ferredoxin oxidoreductase beta subunit